MEILAYLIQGILGMISFGIGLAIAYAILTKIFKNL